MPSVGDTKAVEGGGSACMVILGSEGNAEDEEVAVAVELKVESEEERTSLSLRKGPGGATMSWSVR